MSDNTPLRRDADDAHPDDAAPTDAVSDEVKEDAANAGSQRGDDNESFPQDPSLTHP